MPLPANTPDFAAKAPETAPKQTAKATGTMVKPGTSDPRKVAAQELAKAHAVFFDAEDQLKAATELVAAKAKAFDAIRKAK